MESNTSNRLIRAACALCVAGVVLFCARGFCMEISLFTGSVAVHRGDARFSPEVGSTLKTADVVVTGKGGLAVLSAADGSQIRILEKSRVKIGSAAARDSETVSVISGSVNAKFQKLLKEGDRRVCTPTTVCAVRGTEFYVAVGDGADSRIDLIEGKLSVRNPYGKTDLDEKQYAEVAMNEAPAKNMNGAPGEEWLSRANSEFEKNPESRGERYRLFVNKLSERSSRASDGISGFGRRMRERPLRDRKAIEKMRGELDAMGSDVADDIFLGEAVDSSIEGIMERFRSDREEMYSIFLRIKEESNRVREQQRVNFEALTAVREAYRKNYEEIMKAHKERTESIKGGFEKDRVKPVIKP